MSKVIVTGQGVGRHFHVCQTSNLNFSWLLHNPSVLVWAEKILIPHSAWEAQIYSKENQYDKAINLILEIAFDKGLIELIMPNNALHEDLSNDVLNAVRRDMEAMLDKFPEIN